MTRFTLLTYQIFKDLFLSVCIHVGLCKCECRCPLRPEECISSLELELHINGVACSVWIMATELENIARTVESLSL